MSRHNRSAAGGPDRSSLYREITDTIIEQLQAGRVPWIQPWGTPGAKAPLGMPRNAATGRRYGGINVLLLWQAVTELGFAGQSWLTYRQARSLGGNVRKGERGTTIVYADRFVPQDERRRAVETGDDARTIPFLRRFTVFNTDQCQDLPTDLATHPPASSTGSSAPQLDRVVKATGVDFRIGGDLAFYSPSQDLVQVPPPQAFPEPVNWLQTAWHELSHATGHFSRLGRDLTGAFGSRKYAFEELVAEISCAFCCATLGIMPTVRHSDYIGSWIDVLSNDHRALIRAASRASKAADYLLAFLPQDADHRTGSGEAGCSRRPAPGLPRHAADKEDRSRSCDGSQAGRVLSAPVAETAAMATASHKIRLSSIRDIPFDKLVPSLSNVRRIKTGVSIEELAASGAWTWKTSYGGTTMERRLTVIDKLGAADPATFPASPGIAPDVATLIGWIGQHVPPRPAVGAAARAASTTAGNTRPGAVVLAHETVDWTPSEATRLRDPIHDDCTRQSIRERGSRTHPTKLVQSATMDWVAPPQPSHRPRPRVVGAHRIDLSGFSDTMRDRLRAYGLFHEIISRTLRMFVPTGAHGLDVLAKLLERYSVAQVGHREATP